jgi:hypothetical protein
MAGTNYVHVWLEFKTKGECFLDVCNGYQ